RRARDGAGGTGGGCPMTRDGGAAGGPGRGVSGRLRSFGAFWYDFIVGDDWRGAVAVVLALAVTALLVHVAEGKAWWLTPVGVFAGLGWALAPAPARARGTALTVGRGLSRGRAP